MGFFAWVVKMLLKLAKILYKLGILNEDSVSKLMGYIDAAE